jgi:tetratricopeptide (TPR) repeat protein
LNDAVAAARDNQAQIDALWDWEDPTGSEGRFQAAADAADSELTRDVLLTQVARALGLQQKYAAAGKLLDSLSAPDPELRVRVELERGRVLNSSGSPAEARPLFESAFEAASAADFEHLAVDALHMVAIVAAAGEQEPLNRRALELAAGADDPRARQWRASLLNNLGWTTFDRGDYPAALALFEDALVERAKQGKVAQVQVARWCVGRTLRALSRLDEALAVQRALAADHAAAGTSDPFVQEELTELESALRAGSPQNQAPADPPATP